MRLAFLTLMVVLGIAGAGCAGAPSAASALDCPPIYNGCFAD